MESVKQELIGVPREVLLAILNAAQDGKEPAVAFSRDPLVFAQRAVALSMKKCGQVAEITQAVLSGENVTLPPEDSADGEMLD